MPLNRRGRFFLFAILEWFINLTIKLTETKIWWWWVGGSCKGTYMTANTIIFFIFS